VEMTAIVSTQQEVSSIPIQHIFLLQVTAAVILGISILGFLCHVPRCVRGIWKRLSLVKWNCFCPSVRDECLSEQICQQKTALSQKFSWYVSKLGAGVNDCEGKF